MLNRSQLPGTKDKKKKRNRTRNPHLAHFVQSLSLSSSVFRTNLCWTDLLVECSVLFDVDKNFNCSREVSREQNLCVIGFQGTWKKKGTISSTDMQFLALRKSDTGWNGPDGIVSESVESRLLRSASGFSASVSWGTIRSGWGANTAEVTTALCAARQKKPTSELRRLIHK